MGLNFLKIKNKLKTTLIWVGLALYYFAIGLQISFFRGIMNAALFISMQLFIYLINVRRLLPKYYLTQKRKYYLCNIIIMIIISGFGVLAEYIFRSYFPDSFKHEFSPWWIFTMINVMLGISLWASVTTFLIRHQEKVAVEMTTLRREKAESDLRFLKTQINPHFLFNALNNIYSMAYTGAAEVPEKITMLSDMLRYVLYDCESDTISLYKEIDYISSFLEFQQLKTEQRQNITFERDIRDENFQIAPMLLVPFIENAFKHSKIEREKDGFVNISIVQDKEKFVFRVINSKPKEAIYAKSNQPKGIGIENAYNRLNLLYPNKHFLKINNFKDTFEVILELEKYYVGKK